MIKPKKCGKGILKAFFSCAGVAKSQDPFTVGSCFWEIKDATATCWKEVRDNKKSSFTSNPQRVFMNPSKYNFRSRYIKPIRSIRHFDSQEERELKRIVERLNREKDIKQKFKPNIKSGILLVSCNNCGHKQQIKLVKLQEYHKFKCENCNCESEFKLNI